MTQRELSAGLAQGSDGSSGVDEAVMLEGLEIGFRRDNNMRSRDDSIRFPRKARKEDSSPQNGNSNAGRGYFKEDDAINDFSRELDIATRNLNNQKVSAPSLFFLF